MKHKEQYERGKETLLNDKAICKPNRKLFAEFLEWEEYKLKRTNNLSKLDEGTYKTLIVYVLRFRNVNKWFKNKELKKLTEKDIKKVYDDLEEGIIKNGFGEPYKDRRSYYNKIFKSKLFELAGKKEIAKKVMAFYKDNSDGEVRFIEFEDFKKLVDIAIQPEQKLLLWLCWDIGENVNTFLRMTKKHFTRQINPNDKEPEYLVNLPKELLKRSRRARSEITNFSETTNFLDMILEGKGEDEKIFNFEYRQALKFLDRATAITKVKTKPNKYKPTWKDLRSSMACFLLREKWHTDEINARLGHTPSSRELNKYVNFLAIDRDKPKKKLFDNTLESVRYELEEAKKREKLQAQRIENLTGKFVDLQLLTEKAINLNLKEMIAETKNKPLERVSKKELITLLNKL